MAKPWLKYPREFRLQYEAKESDAAINFGVAANDIEFVKWNGMLHLSQTDIILTFDMECPMDFPDAPPKITFAPNDDVKYLKSVCNDKYELKPEYWVWNKNASIYDHLRLLYPRLNK